MALCLRYKACVCDLVSVLLAGKGGMASKQRCAGRVLFADGEGYFCWVVRQRRAKGEFLRGSEHGNRGTREGDAMEDPKRIKGWLSLTHHWEMPCKCKLSVHPGCSGERRSEGGCLRAQEGVSLMLI